VEIKTLVLFSIGLTTAPSYLVVVVMQWLFGMYENENFHWVNDLYVSTV
jgi:hypothetical protein